MAKPMKNNPADYSNQFKPAIQLGAMSLAQLGDLAYAMPLQEKVDASGEHFLRLGRGLSTDPGLSAVTQLLTTVPGFAPKLRQVEVTGKKGYTAWCVEGGTNQLGVFVYLTRTADAGGNVSEFHINTRYLPYAMLTDLVVGTTKDGLLEIKLPEADIAKLNVTLRLSLLNEPVYRTYKTELLFENMPTAVQQTLESQLNLQTASVAAFLAFQVQKVTTRAAAPTGVSAAALADPVEVTKSLLLAIVVTSGAVLAVVNQGLAENPIGGVGAGLLGAGAVFTAWERFARAVRAPAPQPQPQPQPPHNDDIV